MGKVLRGALGVLSVQQRRRKQDWAGKKLGCCAAQGKVLEDACEGRGAETDVQNCPCWGQGATSS